MKARIWQQGNTKAERLMRDKNLRYIHNIFVLSGNMLMAIMAIHWQKPPLINTAQQSVHLTLGSLRHFLVFSTPQQNSAPKHCPRPPGRRACRDAHAANTNRLPISRQLIYRPTNLGASS